MDYRHRIKAMHSVPSPGGRIIFAGFSGYKHAIPNGTNCSQLPNYLIAQLPNYLITQLPYYHHFILQENMVCGESIQVDTTWQNHSIDDNSMLTWIQLTIEQRTYLLPKNAVNSKRYLLS